MEAPSRKGRPLGFETIEHTADTGIRAWADSVAELFAEAARALLSVMGTASGPALAEHEVFLEARDPDELIERWLSEVLYLFEVSGMVPAEFDVDVHEDPWRLYARVRGPASDRFVQSGPAVKAVTYHDLFVRRRGRGWETQVYLDV